jgi:outer membrane lipase/esterase
MTKPLFRRPRSSTRSLKSVASWVLSGLGAALLVAACGGNSTQVEPFVATRVVAFGDEHNIILADGRKYTVNGLTDGAIDCNKNPIWVQRLSNSLRVPMRECPLVATAANAVVPAAVSFSRAALQAKVQDVRAQLDQHAASDTFGDRDLYTVFVGLHDILEAHASVPTVGEPAAIETMRARGRALGALVNDIANRGPRVLIVTVPDVGRTPFGFETDKTSPGQAALLYRLTNEFNVSMRLELINDGRRIGLVDGFDLFALLLRVGQSISASAAAFLTTPSCLPASPVPDCTAATLITGQGTTDVANTYFWADPLHMGPSGHSQLGGTAEVRARNNPF